MNTIKPAQRKSRWIALLLTVLLTLPLVTACGSKQASIPPPVDDTRAGQTVSSPNRAPEAKKGMSNTQKVAILAGAAALYYIYNQHKNKQGQGKEGQYYLSKNGRVYYRDANKQAHWVTPPSEGIKVPEAEAERYREFEGYNNRPTGRDLTGVPEAATAVPAQ